MKVGNLVRVYGSPLEGEYENPGTEILGVIESIDKFTVKIKWPNDKVLTFRTVDVETLDRN